MTLAAGGSSGLKPTSIHQHDGSWFLFSIKINEKRMASSAPSKKLFYFSLIGANVITT